MILTTSDVQAIKGATRFTVRLTGNTSRLECIKHTPARKSGPFSAAEHELSYAVVLEDAPVDAFFYIAYPGGAFDALRLILKAGDDMTIYARENGNQYVEDAGLHVDECVVNVRRNDKSIIDGLVLTSSICPDNSARAVRPSRPYSLTA